MFRVCQRDHSLVEKEKEKISLRSPKTEFGLGKAEKLPAKESHTFNGKGLRGDRGTLRDRQQGQKKGNNRAAAHFACTLFLDGLLLLHGHQGREMGLIVGQNQWGTMALAGRDFQGQINATKGDWSKRWKGERRLR